jgi:hypothetical protein
VESWNVSVLLNGRIGRVGLGNMKNNRLRAEAGHTVTGHKTEKQEAGTCAVQISLALALLYSVPGM